MDPREVVAQAMPRPGENITDWRNIVSARPAMDVSVLRELSLARDIPEEIKELMWAFFSQENVWAKTDNKDVQEFTNMFLLCWDWVEYMSPEELQPRVNLIFINLLAKFKFRLKRSDGGFERDREVTTIAEANTPQRQPQRGMLGGFFGRVKGAFM